MINGGWTWLLVLPAALLVAAALACLRARQLMGLPREAMRKWRHASPLGKIVVVVLVLVFGHDGATKLLRNSPSAQEATGVSLPRTAPHRGSGTLAASAPYFTDISTTPTSVWLSAEWPSDLFLAPPFIEFYMRTNLADTAVLPLGWAETVAGETNICVEIGQERMPDETLPPIAFFTMRAFDGLGGDGDDDDGDGLSNAEERALGTNPRRVDTDGDGYDDGQEASIVQYGATFPVFDLSSVSNVLAGTQPYAYCPAYVVVNLPFAVELAGHLSTNVAVHFAGIAEFLELGTATSAAPAYASPYSPSPIYNTANAAVSAYGYMFMPMGYAGSQLRAGVVSDVQGRWLVAEWRDMMDPMGWANLTFDQMSFQLAVSEAEPDTVHVRYLYLDSCFDGTSAIIGAHGFGGTPDLLVAEDVSGSVTSGMTISYRFGTGTNPLCADTDGDGLPDGWEAAHGMDPLSANTGDPRTDASADPDLDGLTNAQEAALGTDPFQPDSDGDGMDDGWESRYGFDPTTHNSQTERTDDDADIDSDGDGLTNADECAWRTNPGSLDTDNDGVNDGVEIAQNSDPADATDEGKPNSRTPVQFYFGDHSSSHSEKYQLTVVPVVNRSTNSPRPFAWVNANYGACETRTAMLTPGYSYEVRLAHASTNRPQGPDYDYTLNAVNVSQSVSVLDPDNLLGVHLSGSTFTGGGLVATLTAYKVDVAVCSPDDPDWSELDVSRVILDNEELRIKVTVTPQMSDLSACRQKFGDSITIRTSGTCPQGTSISLDGASFANAGNKSEIRLSRSFTQVRALGLLPAQDDDGVNEMAWMDIVQTSVQNYADSEAFSELGSQFRGKATLDDTSTLDSIPPNSVPSVSYMRSAGCEVVTATYWGVDARKRQITNQADFFYFSGHGNHYNNTLQGGFTPLLAHGSWDRDLDVVIIAGCSVLDINDYNGNYSGAEHSFSPGYSWESTGPSILLGYAYVAPGDASGIPTRIVRSWRINRNTRGDVDAWMSANANNRAWNACAIVKGQKYVYFKFSFKGVFKKKVEVPKEDW